MSELSVSEIWRYPIKSVGGERVSVATVTDLGVLGDRAWGIFDVDTGTVLTARRTPALLFASSMVHSLALFNPYLISIQSLFKPHTCITIRVFNGPLASPIHSLFNLYSIPI